MAGESKVEWGQGLCGSPLLCSLHSEGQAVLFAAERGTAVPLNEQRLPGLTCALTGTALSSCMEAAKGSGV